VTSSMRRIPRLPAAALALCAMTSCSDAETLRGGTTNSGTADQDGDGIPDAQDPDVDGDGIPNAEDPDYVPPGATGTPGTMVDFMGCAGTKFTADGTTLEMLILFDKSSSMSVDAMGRHCSASTTPGVCDCNKSQNLWPEAVGSINGFLDASASEPTLNLAYKAFSPKANDPDPGIPSSYGDTCSVDYYSQPDVPMGPAITNAAAIRSAVDATCPDGDTATTPALEGALEYFADRSSAPGYNAQPMVLLITDGEPDENDCPCGDDEAPVGSPGEDGCEYLNNVATAADMAARLDAAGVPVYVVAMGDELATLDQIATAGGTGDARVLSGANFLDTINELRDSAIAELPCVFNIPDPPAGMDLDYGRVALTFTDGQGNARQVPKAADVAGCQSAADGVAWHYTGDDGAGNPGGVSACPSACDLFKATAAGQVEVVLGCAPELVVVE